MGPGARLGRRTAHSKNYYERVDNNTHAIVKHQKYAAAQKAKDERLRCEGCWRLERRIVHYVEMCEVEPQEVFSCTH